MDNRIKELRKSKKLSQEALANACEVSRQTINAIENNKYDPSLELAFQLAENLEVSVDELFLYKTGESIMGNVKKNYVLATIILLSCAFVLFTIYITDFKDGVRLGVTGVIAIVGVITTLCQLATWGFDRKVQKMKWVRKLLL
ncbi:helix-turn-helix transcriptional regulator [Bacillus megaterium NBRC 15308 = ATCC 14581]|nr:helix-turn-helix transcriptional regulator [Priestia megaterium NBRC 15308 = ATCC 14581]